MDNNNEKKPDRVSPCCGNCAFWQAPEDTGKQGLCELDRVAKTAHQGKRCECHKPVKPVKGGEG